MLDRASPCLMADATLVAAIVVISVEGSISASSAKETFDVPVGIDHELVQLSWERRPSGRIPGTRSLLHPPCEYVHNVGQMRIHSIIQI